MNRAQFQRALIAAALGGIFTLIVFARVPFCPMASVLGIPCPGCGLTRATLALARGDLRQAFALHPLVFVLSPLFIVAVSNTLLNFVRGPSAHYKPTPWLATRTATLLASALLVATLGVWGARFLGYLGGPAPVQTFSAWSRSQVAKR